MKGDTKPCQSFSTNFIPIELKIVLVEFRTSGDRTSGGPPVMEK